jgi:hypothetical protein
MSFDVIPAAFQNTYLTFAGDISLAQSSLNVTQSQLSVQSVPCFFFKVIIADEGACAMCLMMALERNR